MGKIDEMRQFDQAIPNPFVDDPTPPSAFFPASTLAGKSIPPRVFVVPDLVPSKTVTLFYGDGGTGKSLLSLQLAYAVATGRQWLGRKVLSGGSIFISAEDDTDELHRRISDIIGADGASFDSLDSLTLRSLAGEDALLAALDKATGILAPSALYAEIDRQMTEDSPALVVLDTLADMFPGNENDRTQVRQFVGLLKRLAIRHDCAVVMLAHPSRSGLSTGNGDGGSTAWNGSARSRLYMERVIQDGYEANADARILTSKKMNYGPTGTEIQMTWRNGVFVMDSPPDGLDRMAATAKAERVFLKLLRTFTEQGRRVNHAGGPTYAPKIFAESTESEGVTKRALKSAMDALFAAGKIAVEETGPASKRRSHLTFKAE